MERKDLPKVHLIGIPASAKAIHSALIAHDNNPPSSDNSYTDADFKIDSHIRHWPSKSRLNTCCSYYTHQYLSQTIEILTMLLSINVLIWDFSFLFKGHQSSFIYALLVQAFYLSIVNGGLQKAKVAKAQIIKIYKWIYPWNSKECILRKQVQYPKKLNFLLHLNYLCRLRGVHT